MPIWLRWIRKKYKWLRSFKKADQAWQRITHQYPRLFGPLGMSRLLLVIRMTRAE